MTPEFLKEKPEAPQEQPKKSNAIHIGRTVDSAAGAFNAAEMSILPMTQTGELNEDVAKILTGSRLTQKINELIASRKDDGPIILDLTGAKLYDEAIDALNVRRAELARKGITLTVTGVSAADEMRMKTSGFKVTGADIITSSGMQTKLAEKTKKEAGQDKMAA